MANAKSNLPLADREVFSSQQAADLFGFSQATVIRCCDSGDLKHYRLPSPGRDRRIYRRDLIAWAKRHGLPLGWAKEVNQQEARS